MNCQNQKLLGVPVGLAAAVMGATICGAVLHSAMGRPNRRAFLLGGSRAEKALRFNPFTLRTLPANRVARVNSRAEPRPRRLVRPAPGVRAPSVRAAPGARASGAPEPRIPSRPTFRSPVRPGW